MVPTELGITVIKGYQLIDAELCRPQVRAHVERQIGMIAKGQADKQAVVDHCLLEFQQKFTFFVGKIDRMDALFEASFSPLSASGDRGQSDAEHVDRGNDSFNNHQLLYVL